MFHIIVDFARHRRLRVLPSIIIIDNIGDRSDVTLDDKKERVNFQIDLHQPDTEIAAVAATCSV